MRFELALGQDTAQGLMGGYVDIDSWHTHSNKTRDTAISGAMNVRFTQVLVKHTDAQVAGVPAAARDAHE